MRSPLIVLFLIVSPIFAQEVPRVVTYQTGGAFGAVGGFDKGAPVQGAPYSATITNEFIQTLADGNRIVQTSTGTVARDSQGRTRQDAPLPTIANLSPANAPHLVFIEDPVAQTSYVLNLTDKTAQKMPVPPLSAGTGPVPGPGNAVFIKMAGTAAMPDLALPGPPPPGLLPGPVVIQKSLIANDQAQPTREDLGSQVMEGVPVTGTRETRTIPAGQIGNDKPITIVTEVWTSPDLKTIILSKRSDPRMGDQTFQLTNIMRAEPDPALFTVPSDFAITSGPRTVVYRSTQ